MTPHEEAIANLRRLADLLENDGRVVLHGVDVAFFPKGELGAAEIEAIMAALPLPWKVCEPDKDGSYQLIKGNTGLFDVTIFARPDQVGTQTGVQEIPVWEVKPGIAKLAKGSGS